MPAKKTTEKSELSFEKSLERLNEIADILENKNISWKVNGNNSKL